MSIALKEFKCFCPECHNACHGLRALLGFQPPLLNLKLREGYLESIKEGLLNQFYLTNGTCFFIKTSVMGIADRISMLF